MRVAVTAAALVLAATACTTDVRQVPVTSGVTTLSSKTVYERRHEETEARETRWLGRSADGQTGFKEHLVGWRGPGTTPRKAVVPYPLIVHDGPYRFRVSRIYGGPYRSRWGGWCWNYVYRAEQKPGVMNDYRAFACQRRDGRWVAYKNQSESPAGRRTRSNVGNLQDFIQQILQ